MSIFSGIKDAKVKEGGNYIKPGRHELKVVRWSQGKTRHHVPFIAVDFEVVASEAHFAGETVNVFYGADKDAFLPNVKSIARAVLSSMAGTHVSADTIDEDIMEGLVGVPTDEDGRATGAPGTMSAGAKVRALAVDVPTKTGGTYTRISWEPMF